MSKGKADSIALTATCSGTEIVIRSDKEIYNVWRRLDDAKEWGEPIVQRLIGMEFVDNNFQPGKAQEYKVRDFNGATAYILAGSKIPLVDSRGKLILIVESTHAAALAVELARFEQDIVSEGWEVIRRECSRNDSPESVKAIVRAEYDKDPANVRALILFGACPVKMAGPINYDGHGLVRVAADTFYGSFGEWSENQTIIP